MTTSHGGWDAALSRALQILDDFQAPEATAPWLLCDRHPQNDVALRFVESGGDLKTWTMTYGELAERSRRVASVLDAQGVGPGDRVASLLGKGVDLPALVIGIWRLGAVYVPLFTAFAASTVADRVQSSGARVVVTDDDQMPKTNGLDAIVMIANRPAGAPAVPDSFLDLTSAIADAPTFTGDHACQGPQAPLVHMFTSGTTGKPKAVVHPLLYGAGWQSYLEIGLAPGEVFWCGADPGWAYGLYTLLLAPLSAAIPTLVTCGTFKPAATWEVLERFEVTDFAAAPTVFRALRAVDAGTPLPHLKRLSSAGEPLTPEVGEWTRARFGADVHDHFGQTELGMPAGFAHAQGVGPAPLPGAMGTAFPGWTVLVLDSDRDRPAQVGDVGRLAIDVAASPFFTFTGYGVQRDERASRFVDDGRYFVTGDLASIDDQGIIRFSARDDDVILMAGYRIGPFDIESVLMTHPAVRECAVVAAPDEVRGEVVHAFVVTDATGNDDLTSQLQDWVRTHYGAHAYPRAITFVDSLPKTPSGKIQRVVLRRQLADGDQVGSR